MSSAQKQSTASYVGKRASQSKNKTVVIRRRLDESSVQSDIKRAVGDSLKKELLGIPLGVCWKRGSPPRDYDHHTHSLMYFPPI